MKTDLKPCPFCAGKVKYNYNMDLEPDGITCMRCRYILRFIRDKAKPHEQFGEIMAKMAEVWNRRDGR